MIQGTASHVGKSLLVAGLCRLFHDEGWRVAPFKAQNMALNAYITRDGGEIGWAQAVQAEAARVEPTVEMNPILLKPYADSGSQVILRGKVWGNCTAHEYYGHRALLWEAVRTSYHRLAREYDLILIEGAGSPAEPNLMAHDLANMAVARLTRAPVLLVGDIDRGGVFAALLGTLALLPPRDRRRVRALIVNKFRGDSSLLAPGIEFLERKARRPVLGILPYLHGLAIPEEDSVALEATDHSNTWTRPSESQPEGRFRSLRMAVVRLPHIANFTDFSPLEREPGVQLYYLEQPAGLGQADLLLLPGSKNTIEDLRFLKRSGWAEKILSYHRQGGLVGGICGGLQMLGLRIEDPEGLETGGEEAGLGLLPLLTRLEAPKVTRRVRAALLPGFWGAGQQFEAYEIHSGRSWPTGECSPLFELVGQETLVGYRSPDGRAWGCYLHGLFDSPGLRQALFGWVAASRPSASLLPASSLDYRALREASYDRLAETLRAHLSLERLWELVAR